jgi:hypothetical protein
MARANLKGVASGQSLEARSSGLRAALTRRWREVLVNFDYFGGQN